MNELRYVSGSQSRRKKPGPTAKYRAKRRRAEQPVARLVRSDCEERDGYCRLVGLSPCAGPSEWAHLEEKKRARTRGTKPEERHTTTHSMMACQKHHRLYDAGQIEICLGEHGANGWIRAKQGDKVLVC